MQPIPYLFPEGFQFGQDNVVLHASGRSVTDVALDAGFTSLSAFSRLFRSRYALAPSSVSKIRKIGQARR